MVERREIPYTDEEIAIMSKGLLFNERGGIQEEHIKNREKIIEIVVNNFIDDTRALNEITYITMLLINHYYWWGNIWVPANRTNPEVYFLENYIPYWKRDNVKFKCNRYTPKTFSRLDKFKLMVHSFER